LNREIKKILQELPYRIKIMAGIVIAETIMLSLVLFWPVPNQDKTFQDVVFSDDDIALKEVEITTQKSSPPPPPTPQVPVPVPNDQVIEEEPIVLEELDLDRLPTQMEEQGIGVIGDAERVAANPQLPPSIVRIVEPTIPAAAKKADIKVRVWVNFLVNQDGVVEDASISLIQIYDDDEEKFDVVDRIDYGLTEAILEAALKWKFRPAKDQGKVVKAYTKHIFSYGFEN